MKNKLYKFKRVLQTVLTVKSNFTNWDDILKRQLKGLSLSKLKLTSGLSIDIINSNGLRIHNEIFIQNIYEEGEVRINEGDIVFDIGANIGVFSLYAANKKASQVFSFEPDDKNYSYLSQNVSKNSLENIVKPFNFGLANSSGKRYLQIAEIPGGHQMLRDDENFSQKDKIIVTKTFSDFIEENKITRINFVKMDCEGAEGEILDSLNKMHFETIDKFAIEFHDNRSILSHDEIINLLNKNDFKTEIKWNGSSNYGYIFAFKK
jgi:FkbM family methyltransferase